MAKKTHNELTAGIFVVLSIIAGLAVVIWLGGAGLFRPTRQEAIFYLDESAGSAGLIVGSFVQVGDDQIGKVTNIRFDPETSRTLYTAKIDREGFKVYADGEAQVAAAFIGGARLVIVDRGSDTQPLADEDHALQLSGGMDQTMSDLASAAKKVDDIAAVIQVELNAQQANSILAHVHEVIASLRDAAADVATIAANIKPETDRDNSQAMLAKVHKSVDDINKMTTDGRDITQKLKQYTNEDIGEILANLRQSNTKILKITTDFAKVSEQVKQVLFLNRDNIDTMIDNMTHVSANLKATSKEIRRNPWRLIYKPDEKQIRSQNIYDAARAFSDGAEQLDRAIAKMNGLAKASPQGIPADDPQLLKVREQLEKVFGKFSKAEQSLWKELDK